MDEKRRKDLSERDKVDVEKSGGMGASLKRCDVRLMCRWSGMSFLELLTAGHPITLEVVSCWIFGALVLPDFSTDACCCTCSLNRLDSISHLH